jgi:hypothetical protein
VLTVGQHQRTVSSDNSSIVEHEFEVIVDRLRASYPDLVETDIRTMVREVARDFEGARLRPFVPLLVEKIARDECRHRRGDAPVVVRLPN